MTTLLVKWSLIFVSEHWGSVLGQIKKSEKILKYKLIYTALILFVYVLGKGIPLYMIDVSAYLHKSMDAEGLLLQTISGDVFQCSIFALGISPYMMSSIIVQVLSACRGTEAKAKISQVKMNKIALGLTIIIAPIQAVLRVVELKFRVEGDMLLLAQVIAVVEMVAGAMIIVWLCSRNKKYGVGGQTALIFVNVLDGIIISLKSGDVRNLVIPLLVSLVVMVIMIFMENTEKRIPVQRVSIHNIYEDKNYLAIKLNPIGVMPAMFSMAFFMLPQLVLTALLYLYPQNETIWWLQQNLTLNKPMGIGVYITILYLLTLGFSRVFINPKEMTEQFLKSGDSLRDIHAGRDTRRYLSGVITRLGLLSATVMSVCLALPLLMQLSGEIDSAYAMLPSSIMIMTGIWCNLYREVRAIQDLEAYKPFI